MTEDDVSEFVASRRNVPREPVVAPAGSAVAPTSNRRLVETVSGTAQDAAECGRVTRAAELRRIRAEGVAAGVDEPNPYRGELVNAAVWRGGYREMLHAMLASSPARQSWLARTAQALASARGESAL